MPWGVLGIEQEGASERDVKRAYARLLKRHRPEEDPEGFQRIHHAYLKALNELKVAKEFPSSNPPGLDFDLSSEAPSAPVQSPARPEPLEPELSPSTPGEYYEVRLDSQPQPDLKPERPLRPPPSPMPKPIVAKDVKIVELLADLEAGNEGTPMRVLDKVMFRDKHRLKLKLANAILTEPARFVNNTSIRFTRRLAMLIAFHHAPISERLLDMLFQNLAPKVREYALARPMWLLAAAPEFKAVINKGHWDFWCAAFTNPELIDWDSKLAGFALGEADRLGHWEGYEGLDQVVPEAKQLWNQRPARAANRPRSAAERAHGRQAIGYFVIVVSLIFIVIGAGKLAFFTSPDPAPWNYSMPDGWTPVGEPIPIDWEAVTQTNLPDGTYSLPALTSDTFEQLRTKLEARSAEDSSALDDDTVKAVPSPSE